MDDGCEPALVGGRKMAELAHAFRAGFSERLHPRRTREMSAVVPPKKLARERAPMPMPLRRRKSRREGGPTRVSGNFGFMGGGADSLPT